MVVVDYYQWYFVFGGFVDECIGDVGGYGVDGGVVGYWVFVFYVFVVFYVFGVVVFGFVFFLGQFDVVDVVFFEVDVVEVIDIVVVI